MMMVSEIIGDFFSAAALGLSLLALGLIVADRQHRFISLPLAVFFFANALTEISTLSEAAAFDGMPDRLRHALDSMGMPALLTLPAALWFYVRGITSENPPTWSSRDLRHVALPGLGFLLFGLMLVPEDAAWNRLFGEGESEPETLFEWLLILLLVGLVLAWIVQLTVYLFAILRRLVRYRERLHDLFASTEHLEMRWIGWLTLATGGYWLLTVATFVFDVTGGEIEVTGGEPLVPVAYEEAYNFVLIWLLAQWGLRQKPGLLDQTGHGAMAETTSPAKYQKSGLSDDQMTVIAEKIRRAMRDDRIYLEANLSLGDLSRKIGVVPNYVSQTLNAKLGETFFDYVNGWRIREALERVAGSGETVLAIAYDVGFNSRSSFYNAFKAETGMTPTGYREKMAPAVAENRASPPAMVGSGE